jgi:UDP-glucose 4-epimerase
LKVLVTGGAGFIGHHLVRGLLERGDDVAVLDDLSTGDRSRLRAVEDSISFFEGSILDPVVLTEAMAGREVVFHEAAIPSVARSVADPLRSNTVNVEGTIRVMLAASDAGVRRVVFAGSSSVYGVPESLPCRETFRPAPMSPYGTSKLAGEHYVRTLGDLRGLETVTLRYFNVFGPGQDPHSEYAAVVPRFVTAVLEGRRPTVYGDGGVSRDFTYVDNVVHANILAAGRGAPSGITCNVACGSRYSLLELLGAISDAAGLPADPVFDAPRPGDIVHSMADIDIARAQLGYSVVVPFSEGITRTVAAYRATSATPVATEMTR